MPKFKLDFPFWTWSVCKEVCVLYANILFCKTPIQKGVLLSWKLDIINIIWTIYKGLTHKTHITLCLFSCFILNILTGLIMSKERMKDKNHLTFWSKINVDFNLIIFFCDCWEHSIASDVKITNFTFFLDILFFHQVDTSKFQILN